jgi:hypothetical protein
VSTPLARKTLNVSAWVLVAALLAACAPMVPTQGVRDFSPNAAGAQAQVVRLRQAVVFKLSTGYSRTLAANSSWRSVGRIAQGDVYRPVDGILTLEGRNVHEAYLVVNNATLVGFFLPGESNYSPLFPTVPLPIGENL